MGLEGQQDCENGWQLQDRLRRRRHTEADWQRHVEDYNGGLVRRINSEGWEIVRDRVKESENTCQREKIADLGLSLTFYCI